MRPRSLTRQAIQDLCSKAVVGWAACPHMRTSLVLEAGSMATTSRDPAPGLIVHVDRGSQDTSQDWLDALANIEAKPSMGKFGVAWDNAAAESWFAGFEAEPVHPIRASATRHEAVVEIARYIRWHNTSRRHSALHHRSPHQWERTVTLTRAA